MELEEILEQQVEIDELFNHLAKLHRIALFGDDSKDSTAEIIEENLSLNRIRHDITVCLNDLNALNNMLISFDGKIKTEINSLQETKISINKIKSRQIELQKVRKEWQYRNISNTDEKSVLQNPPKGDSIEIKTSYRYKMNKYIEMVGIDNTSLSHKSTSDTDYFIDSREDHQLTGNQTIEALQLLDESHNEIQNEIKTLDTLMNQLKKDAHFVEIERRQKLGFIKSQQRKLDHELHTHEANIKRLLNNCGLVLPSSDDVPISHKILHLSLYWDEQHSNKIKEENEDIINHSDEFIDLKIKALKDQLTHRKNDSTKLTANKNIWKDCVDNLEELEDSLNQLLAVDQTILPSKLIQIIKIKIDYLESLIKYTENNKIEELISDEINSLRMACEELSPKHSQKHQVFENKVNNSTQTKIKGIHSNFHINPSTNIAEPFVVGKTPPKIGISQERANVIPQTSNKKEE